MPQKVKNCGSGCLALISSRIGSSAWTGRNAKSVTALFMNLTGAGVRPRVVASDPLHGRDSAMTTEFAADRYRREAEECALNADKTMNLVDRKAWLRLAEDWMKLARSAELNPRMNRLRH
jgi:hypothetical protein